jgi:formylmethanofuran dehydrogenase subunit C
MPLILQYQSPASLPVDLSGITPDRIGALSISEIERLTVARANRTLALGELFSITGNASDGCLELDGDFTHVHSIGSGMKSGVIRVHGDAGPHLGSRMSGGTIEVLGRAGDWVGAEMSGGLIDVKGSAGNRPGSAYPGSKRGMTDGTILVGGDAGHEVGSRMRRGMIAIAGSCRSSAGFGMIAGSVLVFGECGHLAGAGMRRGTLGLFGARQTELLPTFRYAGQFRPVFFALLFRELTRLGVRIDHGLLDKPLRLHRGDLVTDGKGEIWMTGP